MKVWSKNNSDNDTKLFVPRGNLRLIMISHNKKNIKRSATINVDDQSFILQRYQL